MKINFLIILLCLLSACESLGPTIEQPDDPTLNSEEPISPQDSMSDDKASRSDDEPGNIGGLEITSPENTTTSAFPQPATLIAQRRNTQINLADKPSYQSNSKGYGLPGDSVQILDSVTGDDGNQWYQVRFDVSKAEGWIENRYIQIEEQSTLSDQTTPQNKINSAQISNIQFKNLMALDDQNRFDAELKIIIPTYIPEGFEPKLETIERGIGAPGYKLIYADRYNNCFEIGAISGGIGAAGEDFEIRTVYSQALGNVELGYTKFDRVTNQPRIGFNEFVAKGVIPSSQYYTFWSPSNRENCNAIDFEEAIKIVQSFEYLNP